MELKIENENLQSANFQNLTKNNRLTKSEIIRTFVVLIILSITTLITTMLYVFSGPFTIILFLPLIFLCSSIIITLLNKRNVFKKQSKNINLMRMIFLSLILMISIDLYASIRFFFPTSSTEREVLYYLSKNYKSEFVISHREKVWVKNYCLKDEGINIKGYKSTVYSKDNPEVKFAVYDQFQHDLDFCSNVMKDNYRYVILNNNLSRLKTINSSLKITENTHINLYFEDKNDLDKIISQGYIIKSTIEEIFKNELNDISTIDIFLRVNYFNPKTTIYEEVFNTLLPFYEKKFSNPSTRTDILTKINKITQI